MLLITEHWLIIVLSVLAVVPLLILFPSLFKGLRWLGWGCVHVAVGALVLYLINAVGEAMFDFSLPLNLYTAMVAGILGIPGIGALIVIELFIL